MGISSSVFIILKSTIFKKICKKTKRKKILIQSLKFRRRMNCLKINVMEELLKSRLGVKNIK